MYGVAGLIYYNKNIQDCDKKKEEIVTELSELFKDDIITSANAKVAGMNEIHLFNDEDFRSAVKRIVNLDCGTILGGDEKLPSDAPVLLTIYCED